VSTEIAKAGGTLAIRPDQTTWTPEQGAVLRQSGIGESVTTAELSGFLHLCQRTGLDPFSRQIYLIGRYDKKAGRDVFTPQTGIDGYRVIAQRVTAQTAGTYGYEDTLWCDSSGQWRDVWLADEPPAAAKVTVIRNGARFSAVARFSEYAQTFRDGNLMGLWAKMPAGQIAKCCEALALRRAFPHDLAGVYTAEEMAQADDPAPVVVQSKAVDPGMWDTQGPPSPAQVIADEAGALTDRATFRELYNRAKSGGLLTEQVTAADGTRGELGAYLYLIGERFAPPKSPGESNEESAGTEVVESELVPEDADEVAVARGEMLDAAAALDIPTPVLESDFFASYGHALEAASVGELRQMRDLFLGEAA
jgi:phage recombination protein Bet